MAAADVKIKKRMVDGAIKTYTYQRKLRKNMEVQFSCEADKETFEEKFDRVTKIYQSNVNSSTRPTNLDILNNLFDGYLDDETTGEPAEEKTPDSCKCCNTLPICEQSSMMFVAEVKEIQDLTKQIQDHGRICSHPLTLVADKRSGHVACMNFVCCKSHDIKFHSTSKEGNRYVGNLKLMLGYMCSGMLEAKYETMCQFSDIGCLSKSERNSMMDTFSLVVQQLAQESIQDARTEEQGQSLANGDHGIGIITDARHSCRKNSYHTDHVALGQLTHKIVDIRHITKDVDKCTQRHESLGFDLMYEGLDQAGIAVHDHAHDRNPSINKKIRNDRKETNNSNDRWHATKGIPTSIKKIGCGAKKNEGKTWSAQLADKGTLLKTHFYWAMDKCEGDGDRLRDNLGTCITHFQNEHSHCDLDSSCRKVPYIPSFVVITDECAVELLTDFIHSHTIYKSPVDYLYGRDTGYVESCNNVALIYLDKRIHYGEVCYKTRQNMWVLDWNEHVDRPITSRSDSMSAEHNRRNLGKKRYTKKTYDFVTKMWNLWVAVHNA